MARYARPWQTRDSAPKAWAGGMPIVGRTSLSAWATRVTVWELCGSRSSTRFTSVRHSAVPAPRVVSCALLMSSPSLRGCEQYTTAVQVATWSARAARLAGTAKGCQPVDWRARSPRSTSLVRNIGLTPRLAYPGDLLGLCSHIVLFVTAGSVPLGQGQRVARCCPRCRGPGLPLLLLIVAQPPL